MQSTAMCCLCWLFEYCSVFAHMCHGRTDRVWPLDRWHCDREKRKCWCRRRQSENIFICTNNLPTRPDAFVDYLLSKFFIFPISFIRQNKANYIRRWKYNIKIMSWWVLIEKRVELFLWVDSFFFYILFCAFILCLSIWRISHFLPVSMFQ